MYYLLKGSVRLRKEPFGATLYDSEREVAKLITPSQAVILSLLNGERSLDQVARIVSKIYRVPFRKAYNDIISFISKIEDFLDKYEHPVKRYRREYSYKQFMFKPEPPKYLRPDTPILIVWILTKRCNLRCIYCYANSVHVSEGRARDLALTELKPEAKISLVKEIIDMGVQKVLFSEGEPTLVPELPRMVRLLYREDVEVFISTNGYSLKEKYVRKLRDSGLEKIQAKLDGSTPEIQDKLSGTKGSFKSLIKGIEILKKNGFEVAVASVVTSINIRDIPNVIKLCINLDVDEFRPAIYIPGIWTTLEEFNNLPLFPSMEDSIWLNKVVDRLRKEYKGIIKIKPYEPLKKRPPNKVPLCTALILGCCILPDGRVSVCEMVSDYSSDFIIGDIKKDSLYRIWHSEKAIRWLERNNIYRFSENCLNCERFNICRGGCPWRSVLAYGTPFKCDPFCVKSPKPTRITLPFIE